VYKLENHLVDERYELVALIFRLTGNIEYNEVKTKYQRKLNLQFENMKDHPAVIYARKLNFGFDAVFFMAIHLEKVSNTFSLIEDIDFLVKVIADLIRWTRENASEFLVHLNRFYVDSGFAEFFLKHTKFYRRRSNHFKKYALKYVKFDWLELHGLNRAHMKFIISPSNKRPAYGGYAIERGNKTSYACVPSLLCFANYFIVGAVVHELMHSIANPIAEVLYTENEEFRKWCDDSVNKEKLAVYAMGLTMAYEYVTRAYSIWYFAETGKLKLKSQFYIEVYNGFPYIEQVYELLTAQKQLPAQKRGRLNRPRV